MPAITTDTELTDACRRYGINLVSVCSKDQLPKERNIGGYIINMEDSVDAYGNFNKGSHWVSCWLEKDKNKIKAIYYDSFGVVPPKSVQEFLKPFRPYAYNADDIQNIDTGICGYYCFYFLYYMTYYKKKYPDLDKRYDAFLRLWSDDTTQNRKLLSDYLNKIG